MTRRPTRERLWSILRWASEQSVDAAADVRAEIDALTAERDEAREALRREMLRVEAGSKVDQFASQMNDKKYARVPTQPAAE